MSHDNDKPWWHPIPTDEDWCEKMRRDYPKKTKGMSDSEIRSYFADGRKYEVLWDNLGDAYEEYEKLADAFLNSQDPNQDA